MTLRSDITCDFRRAMTGTNLEANARILKAKKELFTFLQHF